LVVFNFELLKKKIKLLQRKAELRLDRKPKS